MRNRAMAWLHEAIWLARHDHASICGFGKIFMMDVQGCHACGMQRAVPADAVFLQQCAVPDFTFQGQLVMGQTIRQRILDILVEGPVTAMKISGAVGIPEKEVAGHLVHIEKTLQQDGGRLVVIPAACRSCGFLFAERSRKSKPGKCPQCRSTFIGEPLFTATMTR